MKLKVLIIKLIIIYNIMLMLNKINVNMKRKLLRILHLS